MPRIDPMKLLVCLSVLLAPNGGIRNAGEVRRLANLMAKFSKKLVSKAIYIQILKCTETELLGQFMQTGGWTLVHTWLVDGIASKNWPLIQELLELLLCCPVDVERLKINSTPRLVKSLSTDSAHESVKVLATKLVEQWLYIVKAPKQLSPMVPTNQAELPAVSGLAGITEGKQQNSDGTSSVLSIGAVAGKQGAESGHGMSNHLQQNGYAVHTASDEVANIEQSEGGRDDVDGKKTFQTSGGELQQALPVVSSKKTSLVLKITTKNGKQVVAKVIKPSRKQQRASLPGANEAGEEDDGIDEEDEEDDDQEEVVVNIESGKSADETVAANEKDDQDVTTDTKKTEVQNGVESSKERNSSSSKDKDRHHHSHRDREKEKDRKGSSSSGSRSSSSKSSSSSSSSSKHKSSSGSSSKSSSSSSSRSKDKDRHGSSSSSSSTSKHKSSSSSSSSKSNSSGSKSGSSSDKHRDHKDKSSHSSSGTSSSGTRDSKSSSSQSFSSSKLSRKDSRDDGASNDSGSESSSTANTSANGAKSSKSASAAAIPSKKASISIEVRNPENRPKTVKTYNSQFRSHGLIEEAPPPPSRKGLKKPSSSSPSTTTSSNTTSSSTIGSTAIGTVKRSSPISSGREAILAGSPVEKKPREDPLERPGSIKLIPPKRQHALVESDMFMDALSATLRKDVKKRKRRTSGSEGATTTTTTNSSKPVETTTATKPAGEDAGTTKVTTPGSPTKTAAAPAEDSASEAPTPTTPTSPKVPTIAPMSFYRDTLAEQEDENGSESGATEDGVKKEQGEAEDDGADGKKIKADDNTEADDEGPILKKPKRTKCELNEDDDEEKDGDNSTGEKTVKKEPAGEGGGGGGGAAVDDDKTELMDEVMHDVEKKIAAEAESDKKEDSEKEEESPTDGKKPPGPGCGPDGPPGVLVIHRRKGPKKQLRWRTAEELEEVRYFELDVTERCNVTKSFTDMKQMERVDERQKFMLSRKVGSEDIMVERTTWRALAVVDNVPPSPDGNQSVERNVQRQRERGCLQALYFNKHMIPDSPTEPDPADIYQTADPVHIPLEDVTGNPDSVNDFTSVPWPDPKSTPPHESGAFNSPFFPSDLPPAAGFGPGGFPPPFAPGAAATIGPGPWNMGPPGGAGPRAAVLPPGMFPLNQPPPGMGPAGGSNGPTGSPNMLNMPLNMSPNVPPPGMFPGATNFNAPPPEIGLIAGGPDMGGRRGPPGGPGAVDFRSGPPPQQQWVTGNRPFVGGNNPTRGGTGGGGFGNRGGGGGGNWNNRNNGNNGNRNGGGDRGRMGDDGRGNYRGHWLQNNRGHNRGGGGRKW